MAGRCPTATGRSAPSRVSTEASRPTRRAERLEPVAQGRPVKVNHRARTPNRRRGSEAARKALSGVGRLALPGRPLAVRVRRPHGSKSSHPIRQFPSSSHEKPICFHRQNQKVSSPSSSSCSVPLGGRRPREGRVFPYSNPPHRSNKRVASDRWWVGSTWWRAPVSSHGAGWTCLDLRIIQEGRSACDCVARPRPAGGGDAQEQGEALRRPAQGLQARQVVSPDRFPFAPAPGWRRIVGILTSASLLRFNWWRCSQQDVAADGGGADQAAAEPEGGAGAPDAPRGRAAARGQPGHDRAHQGTCFVHASSPVAWLPPRCFIPSFLISPPPIGPS
jgi:hypothetical protein